MKKPGGRTAAAGLFILFAGLLLFLGRTPRPSSIPRVTPSLPGPVLKEITVRNGTAAPILYAYKFNGSLAAPKSIEIKPGGLERYRALTPLILTWKRGKIEVTQALLPGNPYVFRPNEEDLPQLYGGSHMRADAADLAPYVPTPMEVVDRMLEMAQIGPRDVLYDLGCGDGRIVIAAALKGARGVGVDIDPERIREAEAAALKMRVADRVRFRAEDALTTDLSGATVVTLYLLPESNALLRPKLEREMKPGTILVSHNYRMPGWESRLLRAAEIQDAAGRTHAVFCYRR